MVNYFLDYVPVASIEWWEQTEILHTFIDFDWEEV
jgi:hypothetical protein